MQLETATSESEDPERIAGLADVCWRHHYLSIIGQAQVDYMLAKFQSSASIREQIKQGRRYEIILGSGRESLGYLAYDLGERKIFLSKLYVLPQAQCEGVGRWALGELCQRYPALNIHLTVNKQNHSAIHFYTQNGFTKQASVVTEIGQGFVMDDWKMLRTASRSRLVVKGP